MTRPLWNPQYVYEHRHKIIPHLRLCAPRPRWQVRKLFNMLGVPLTDNDRRLAALKDIHRGQRAFVIGNGPSLRTSDLDKLQAEVTFACNKIYLAFDETDWRPTYYTVYDVLVAQTNRDTIRTLKGPKLFGHRVKPYFGDVGGIIYVEDNTLPIWEIEPRYRFSKNALNGVYGGATTLYLQMQVALYMGIRELYLIGVDFSFSSPEPTGELTDVGEMVVESSGEVNHFHPDYRLPGEMWTLPRLDAQYAAFRCARNAYKEEGGCILNASRTTALDLFPLVDFDKLFETAAASETD